MNVIFDYLTAPVRVAENLETCVSLVRFEGNFRTATFSGRAHLSVLRTDGGYAFNEASIAFCRKPLDARVTVERVYDIIVAAPDSREFIAPLGPTGSFRITGHLVEHLISGDGVVISSGDLTLIIPTKSAPEYAFELPIGTYLSFSAEGLTFTLW